MLDWLIRQFGLIGLAIASFIANTILPIPFEPVLFLVHATGYNIALWLLIASLAAVAGEFTVYWVARKGKGFIARAISWFMAKMKKDFKAKDVVNNPSHSWLKEWFEEWGFGAIFIGAFTPLPMFLFDIFAGYLEYPAWKFCLATFLGKLARYTTVLLGGTAIVWLFFIR